ncbi:unnamed protein product [Acanthosepion pharaonis]|uniref:Uncharacterized protein n=1 Tax=Acanthosepion pharaonis TaxID=158019 RepID=A0A812BP83_ACAPH|nr:unnamed protein product [Sepia pharaonis]
MLGNILSNRCNEADLTFLELYERTSIELCVVVTNVNAMRAEYWHRKTTPDMSIREAVYMSLSIPVTEATFFTLQYLQIIEECFDYEKPFEQSLAETIAVKNCPLSSKEQILLFSKHLTKVEDCIAVFKEIAHGQHLTPAMLMVHVQRIALSILHDYSSLIGEEVNDMCSFLGNVVQTMNINTNTINENDQKRTVGIFYGHVNNNTLLEHDDQTFLYKIYTCKFYKLVNVYLQQGWNATVAYLSQRENLDELATQINSN